MTIHPFPKSLMGSLGQRYRPVSSLGIESPTLTGVRPAHSASELAAPVLFFHASANADQHQGHGRVSMRDIRSERSQRRNFIYRTEQVLAAAILADEAASDLLDRCVQLRNSLTPHGGHTTMMELQRASKSLRESSSVLFA